MTKEEVGHDLYQYIQDNNKMDHNSFQGKKFGGLPRTSFDKDPHANLSSGRTSEALNLF
jgi:hypothetical protein